MAHDFSEIHMGQRLEHFIKSAKHGSGLGSFSKFSGRGSSSILGLYKSKSLDLDIIERACTHYDVTLSEFLGIKVEELPEAFQTGKSSTDPIEKRLNRIDRNVTQILEHLKK